MEDSLSSSSSERFSLTELTTCSWYLCGSVSISKKLLLKRLLPSSFSKLVFCYMPERWANPLTIFWAFCWCSGSLSNSKSFSLDWTTSLLKPLKTSDVVNYLVTWPSLFGGKSYSSATFLSSLLTDNIKVLFKVSYLLIYVFWSSIPLESCDLTNMS